MKSIRAVAVLMLLTVLTLHGADSQAGNAVAQVRFDVNDVSYLWPVPTTVPDVQTLISANEMTSDNQSEIFPKAAFDTLLENARATQIVDSRGRTHPILFDQFEKEFSLQETWKVVGFRFDPSAPGGHSGSRDEFGETPQLRVVMQPVTITGSSFQVHDVTAHLAFSFKTGDKGKGPLGFPKAVPDKLLVNEILDELKQLRSTALAAGINTAGPLDVHPAFKANVSGFRDQVKVLLKKRMTADRLTELAFMGLNDPEPWIFFGMRRNPQTKVFDRTRPTTIGKADAQMLTFRGGAHVVPTPLPRNLRVGGVSTHVLFESMPPPKVLVPIAADGPTAEEIPDVIADPERSNVINTDCISCHTESSLRNTRNAASTRFAFKRPAGVSGVSPDVLPKEPWNVRNFGWFPSFFDGSVRPTVTQRTANESAEAAAFINEHYLALPGGNELMDSHDDGEPQKKPLSETGASPLTLVMDIKDKKHFIELKTSIERMLKMGDNNPIKRALDSLGTVHFARFAFIGEDKLAVITTYDGDFERYINAFVRDIGHIFDEILKHVKGWPEGWSVGDHRKEFLAFVNKHDLRGMPPFYSAYPNLKVQDILQMENEFKRQKKQ